MPKFSLSKKKYLELRRKHGWSHDEVCLKQNWSPNGKVREFMAADPKFRAEVAELDGEVPELDLESATAAQRVAHTYRQDVAVGIGRVLEKEKFLRLWVEGLSLVEAADASGISVSLLQRYRDEEDRFYDEAFADACKEVELRHAFQVEDNAKKNAIVEDSSAMQKFLLPNLPVVGDKFAKKSSAPAVGSMVLFSQGGLEEAIRFLSSGREIKEIS